MVIKKSSLLLILYFFACTNLFLSKSYIGGIYYLDWIALEIIALFLITMFRSIPRKIDGEMKEFDLCIISVILLNILHVIYTNIMYSQPLIIGLKVSYHFFLLLIFFPLKNQFTTVKNNDYLKQSLVIFVTLCNIYQLLIYFITGRSGCPHFYLILLSLPIATSYVLYKQNFELGMVSIITSILVRVFLSKNMAFIIICCFIFGLQIYIFFYDNYILGRKKMLANILLFVVFLLLMAFGVIELYINLIVNHDIGTKIRMLAIEYYLEKLFDSPMFGLGNLDPNYSIDFYNIIRGGLNKYGGIGQYYIEDVGIIGFVCQYGLISLIPIYYMLCGALQSIKKCRNIERIQCIGILAMLIGMFISLMPFNKAPIQIVPLAFIILYNNTRQYKKTT